MVYKKDYDDWNELHKRLDKTHRIPFFKEREVWWTITGINVGYEEDGKGQKYSRPVLVYKKLGMYTFIGIPLTTSRKTGKLYYQFVFTNNKINTALLAHIKSFDSRRLLNKIASIDDVIFEEIRKAVKDLL